MSYIQSQAARLSHVVFRLLIAAALLVIPSRCLGDMIISFSRDASFANFSVVLGETIEVPIYIIGDARLVNQGLYASGATIHFAYHSGSGSAGSGTASISEVLLDPQWNSPLNYTEINAPAQFAIIEGLVSGPPVTPVFPELGTNYIKIGSVKFLSGSEGNQTSIYLSNDFNSAAANLLYNSQNGDSLDGQIAFVGGSIRTITAVPEPSSLCLFGLVAIGLICTRRPRDSSGTTFLMSP